jgi:hypothetical protein
MNLPFISIDVAEREDGVLRLLEIGDGQVSDRKKWGLQRFAAMVCAELAANSPERAPGSDARLNS